jgi:hypothetical protein
MHRGVRESPQFYSNGCPIVRQLADGHDNFPQNAIFQKVSGSKILKKKLVFYLVTESNNKKICIITDQFKKSNCFK